jgi:hypothetical protein
MVLSFSVETDESAKKTEAGADHYLNAVNTRFSMHFALIVFLSFCAQITPVS